MPEGTKFWSKVVLSTFRLEGTKCLFPATLPGSKYRVTVWWLITRVICTWLGQNCFVINNISAKVEQSRYMLPGPYPGWIDHWSFPYLGDQQFWWLFSLNDVKVKSSKTISFWCEAASFHRKLAFAHPSNWMRKRWNQRFPIQLKQPLIECFAFNCRPHFLKKWVGGA